MTISKNNLCIYLLTIVAFSIVAAELAPMGLLITISQYFNLSITQSSYLISYYAIGVVVGIPLTSSLLASFSVNKKILILIVLFSVGNLLCSIAWNYESLLVARVIAAFSHGTFFGESYLLANRLAAENKRATSVSIISSGLAIASLVGVPISTYLGLKISWRISFLLISIIAFICLLFHLPNISNHVNQKSVNKHSLFKLLFSRKALFPLFTTVFGISGVFTVYSYIGPVLTEVTHIADKNIPMSIIISLTGLVLSLLFLRLSFSSENLMMIGLFLFGIFAFMPITPLQMYIMHSIGSQTSIISSLNIGCFNLGNALGAFVGGRLISTNSFGVYSLPYMAIIFALIGLILMYINLKKID